MRTSCRWCWRPSPGSEQPGDAEALRQSQYKVLQQWQNQYRGNLLVFLPDTFGTTQFLEGAPQWVGYWTGARPDSKEPVEAGEELIAFWRRMGADRRDIASNKLIIFSDGLDVALPAPRRTAPTSSRCTAISRAGCRPASAGAPISPTTSSAATRAAARYEAISLVCKVSAVNGRPAVKLSDNYEKATGPAEEVAAYRAVFGSEGMANAPGAGLRGSRMAVRGPRRATP